MAFVDTISIKRELEDPEFFPRKRFKTSELPINATQKSTIDGLLHTIKKKGEYDSLRKNVWSQFEESAEKTAFTKQLNELAEAGIERDPSLLSRDRGKAATLMSGVVDRSDIYKSVEKTLDALIAKNINHLLQAGREIRRADVGVDIAAAEEKRGNKTDEEYAKEAAVRKEERARERKREEARKRREEEKDRLRAEEAKHMKEIEKLQSQNERRKEREAARAERERAAEERRRRDRPRNDLEAEIEKEGENHKVQDANTVPPTPAAPPMDNKALEEAALALLLQEGRELAAKNGPPKPEPELSDSEVPHRKPHVSPPKGPAADRNKVSVKPRLSYSSTPLHQSSGTPVPPPQSVGAARSRSPYRAPSGRYDRSRSPDYSRRQSRSYAYRDDDARAQADLDHKAIYKAQMQERRDIEADVFKKRGRSERDDGENRSRSPSRATERDPGRDRDRDRDRDRERSKRYDYDYSREHSRHADDRPRSRDRERERPRYEERERVYTRPRREEAPEHIDRYVPGGAAPAREKRRTTLDDGVDRDDKERSVREETRDRDRDRDTRDRDSSYRESKRDYRERSSYHDRDRRDRDDYDRDRYRDREHRDHRDRDRDRDRGEEKGRGYERERERDRDRDGREERPYTRPRREPAPENIDRYVPGAG
ncbi:hypothetical protein IMSHALPRED_006625 [Imshaugia aleurites]|uniref:BOD1/SHG1 domain-containing protein n=1 Tax=Imshaugia aleurites TaxID=172621 RepID=A0A8H3EN27_9LECA|nr:hypothetical protein IMSHALPRED_006625 [Imshaugia aleurites]